MRHLTRASLPVLLLMSACTQTPPAAVLQRPTVRTSVRAASASPRPSPTATPSHTPSESPSASPTPSPTPSVAMRMLTGIVQLDANYAIAIAGGSLVSDKGSSVVDLSAGRVLSSNSAALIGLGAGIGVANGSAYHVLEASNLAPGTLLPAKGVGVIPISLATEKILAPAVYTDDTGAYQVAVPASETGRVLLIAQVPGKTASDPVLSDSRLRYTLIAPDASAQASTCASDCATTIDDDSAVITGYLRLSFVNRLYSFVTTDDPTTLNQMLEAWNLPSAATPLITGLVSDLRTAAKAAGIDQMTPDQKLALTQAAADAVLSRISFDGVNVNPQDSGQTQVGLDLTLVGQLDPVLPAAIGVSRLLRQAAAAKLAQDPHFFDNQAYLTAANTGLDASAPYKILKASDLVDFVVRAYLSQNKWDVYQNIRAVDASMGIEQVPLEGVTVDPADRLCAIGGTVAYTTTFDMIQNSNGAKDAAIAAIQAYKPQ